MRTSDALIAEFTKEAAVTRTVIARVPEEHLDWRPHPKSMSLGQLALHVASLPEGITSLLAETVAEVPDVPLRKASSRAEVLDTFDAGIRSAVARVGAWGDAGLDTTWTLTAGGTPVLERTRGDVVRSLLLNHSVHHRGQLTVYLRMLGAPVPPVYGPTADEDSLG